MPEAGFDGASVCWVGKKLLAHPTDGSAVKPCFWHLAWRAKIFIATHLRVGAQEPVPLHEDYANALKEHRQDPKRTCPRLELRIAKAGITAVPIDPYGEAWQNPDALSLQGNPPLFDAVLIHQGVLDTHKPPGTDDDTLQNWIMKSHPWMVVESGRGIPPGLQKKPIRFLAYSVLDQALGTVMK